MEDLVKSFDPMKLQENLIHGIYAYGFEKTSAIQQKCIFPFCKRLVVNQQAQSGAGKTVTVYFGIIQKLNYILLGCQALALPPSRELAQQIEKVMRALGDYLGMKVHACVGGTSVRGDQSILSSGVHVVVGTTGCDFDMLKKQSLRSDNIRMFVLNEDDEMLPKLLNAMVFGLVSLEEVLDRGSKYVDCHTSFYDNSLIGVYTTTLYPAKRGESRVGCLLHQFFLEESDYMDVQYLRIVVNLFDKLLVIPIVRGDKLVLIYLCTTIDFGHMIIVLPYLFSFATNTNDFLNALGKGSGVKNAEVNDYFEGNEFDFTYDNFKCFFVGNLVSFFPKAAQVGHASGKGHVQGTHKWIFVHVDVTSLESFVWDPGPCPIIRDNDVFEGEEDVMNPKNIKYLKIS